MVNFLNPPRKDWSFKVKNLPDSKKRDKWHDFDSRKSPFILVKIGMTTKLPNQRIKEWEVKCNHKLVNVGPNNRQLIYKSSFVERLSCLTIQDQHYNSYKDDGFYVSKNLKLVESSIHKILRGKYGKGDVYCNSCLSETKHSKDSPFKTDYNVHTEWFLILKKEIDEVYNVINSTCLDQG